MNNYITNRYFRAKFTSSERYEFMRKYESNKWDYAKTHLGRNERLKISKNAIKLADKVKEQLEINLFPLIIPIATKGFDISGGTFSFEMIDDKGRSYYFDCRTFLYLKSKSKLILDIDIIAVI